MKLSNIRVELSLLSLVAVAAIGCKSETNSFAMNDQFQPDNEPRQVHNIFHQQAAIGNREDGQLYAVHFNEGELNSLGRAKLDSMTRPGDARKMHVYLDVPKDSTYGPREAAVISYLSEKGLASNSYNLTAGANPNLSAPAAQSLKGLTRQNKSGAESGSEETATPMGGK
ncbi:MAG TPA: hypothetical protein VGB55_01655 [Tepidisphaeraceae bacterium]|jgi:hypothetical protein